MLYMNLVNNNLSILGDFIHNVDTSINRRVIMLTYYPQSVDNMLYDHKLFTC